MNAQAKKLGSEADVSIERTMTCTPKRAFEAWLDPKALSQFMAAMPGLTISKAEVDVRVGGKFNIVMTMGSKDIPHHGEYLEIARYERLSFTWLSPYAGEGSRVALTFTAVGKNETRVTLEHFGLAPSAIEAHREGWTAMVDKLGHQLG